jgi:hypothetical protein
LVEATALAGQIITYGALVADAVNSTPLPWFPLIAKGVDIRGYLLFELTYDPRRYGHDKPFHPTAYDAAKKYVLAGLSSGALKPRGSPSLRFRRDCQSTRIRRREPEPWQSSRPTQLN